MADCSTRQPTQSSAPHFVRTAQLEGHSFAITVTLLIFFANLNTSLGRPSLAQSLGVPGLRALGALDVPGSQVAILAWAEPVEVELLVRLVDLESVAEAFVDGLLVLPVPSVVPLLPELGSAPVAAPEARAVRPQPFAAALGGPAAVAEPVLGSLPLAPPQLAATLAQDQLAASEASLHPCVVELQEPETALGLLGLQVQRPAKLDPYLQRHQPGADRRLALPFAFAAAVLEEELEQLRVPVPEQYCRNHMPISFASANS